MSVLSPEGAQEIAYVAAAPLLAKAGVAGSLDAGFVLLDTAGDCDGFVAACRQLRFWDRANAER